MEKGIRLTDVNGEVVMEMKGGNIVWHRAELKTPNVDYVDDLSSFLKNLHYRLENIEKEIEKLKTTESVEKVIQHFYDKLKEQQKWG